MVAAAAVVASMATVAAVAIVTHTMDEVVALVVREARLDHHRPAAAAATPSVDPTVVVVTPTYPVTNGLRDVTTDVEDP